MNPFNVDWQTADINRVLEQVQQYQLPAVPQANAWQYGCDADYLAKLQHYWLNDYDWRAAQTKLNRFAQFTATVDDLDIHFLHVIGEANGKRPLLITHGWPSSHFEFWQIIEPLAYPSRFGGQPDDAFDLIIPSLPGFGFSGKPDHIMGQRETAKLWHTLMTDVLGYRNYLAQGGDFGAIVTSWLGLDYPDAVTAIHLNVLVFRTTLPPQNETEAQWLNRVGAAHQALSAYSHLQMTKPMSLIWAMANNPMGQAAWIIERFHDWSDLSSQSFEDLYPMDDLLTNIMVYIMTDSFASAVMYYPGILADGYCVPPDERRVDTPTGYAAFAADALLPARPRSRAELSYNISYWSTPPAGGHFAASEQAQWLVNDLRQWARTL